MKIIIFLVLDGVSGGSPVPNLKLGGLPYEMHRLGGRNEVRPRNDFEIKYLF